MSRGIEKLKVLAKELGSYGSPSGFMDFTEQEYADAGIEKIVMLQQDMIEERRWGYVEQTVFNVDNELVGVSEYVVTGDGDSEGPESFDYYLVQPVPSITYEQIRG